MTDAGPEPEHSESPDGLESAGDSEALPDSEGAEDEARRKFREALERKRARETSTAGGRAGSNSGKVHGVHGPASSRRSFRRRGGG
ncbi:MAG TPA: DUF5302 domain-containing protein [Streptosporangiaceae bacterium]|nr:DUF5302 domain-containing protein [Streptosporangiaceae bacterium]